MVKINVYLNIVGPNGKVNITIPPIKPPAIMYITILYKKISLVNLIFLTIHSINKEVGTPMNKNTGKEKMNTRLDGSPTTAPTPGFFGGGKMILIITANITEEMNAVRIFINTPNIKSPII
ncbi:hypothetical protein ACJROX_28020 [Pseudalkalibacillus sp. A8]|uniref:hypothetical protein n=1 Tax=Pseudalkalibacillus sp. A8 TaxID=3382641 RepID=UPI0038B41C5D